MAAHVIANKDTIRFNKCKTMAGNPMIMIDLYGNSSAVITSKAEAERLVDTLTRAAYTIHQRWSKNLKS